MNMGKRKFMKTELLKNHFDCKRVIRELKATCYDEMEIELVDLLLREHKQLLFEKIALEKRLERVQNYVLQFQRELNQCG